MQNEFYKRFEEPRISNIIKLQRLQYAGHIQDMDEKGIPKRIPESNIFGKTPVGKARKKWVSSV
jgi:hypothetical protein